MTSMTRDGVTFTFEYDEEGRRIRETKGGLVTNYYYSGDKLISEMCGEYIVVYLYDESGSPIGFQYHDPLYGESGWVTFWYEKNLQGDIVAVYSDTGVLLTTYVYDAWGNYTEKFYNTNLHFYDTHSPISYRGYYYDQEYGFYCLGTRFYDPAVGRFINADTSAVITATPTALTDKNLYAYCDNNPVMRTDADGEFWVTSMLIGAAVGVAAQYICDVVQNVREGETGKDIFRFQSSLVDYIAAGVGGAIAAIPGTTFASSLITGAAGNIATDTIKGDISSAKDVIVSGFVGATANGIGYGVSKGFSRLKANKISSMNRTSRKNYLTEKVFKNSRSYANANLNTFADSPVRVLEHSFKGFRYGIYSTVTSTSYTSIYGVLLK